jgi:hypothetical protein
VGALGTPFAAYAAGQRFGIGVGDLGKRSDCGRAPANQSNGCLDSRPDVDVGSVPGRVGGDRDGGGGGN